MSLPVAGEASPGLGGAGPLRWRFCAFGDLSLVELQNIYAARQAVFAIEQQCIYLDVDGNDEGAHHLGAWAESQSWPLAYARLLAPGQKYAEASIGRVLTTPAARGAGLGRVLVTRALVHAGERWPEVGVRISAQARLERFYAGFGFEAEGAPYLEDGIPHVEMLRRKLG